MSVPGFSALVVAARAQEARPQEIESPLPGGVAEAVRFLFSSVPQWVQIGGAVVGVVVAAWLAWYGWRRRYDVWGWLWERSAWVQAGIGLLLVGLLSGAGWFGQRAWDYTQHSNAFCTACHVMAEPFREFQRSAHAGLQCHDCHQQSVFASMRQVYLWVADRPGDIGEHAPVPNGVCAGCHVEGDPERWRQIERSAGHRVHLASDSLEGLQCVECHGASVHRFTPSKATCGQSGCHAEVGMELGGMSDLTVHCVACHDFTRPTGEGLAAPARDTVLAHGARDTTEQGLLRPERRQCLSCHAMRSMLADFPADDPHDARCAACHDPHGETARARAAASCTEGGCHAPLETEANRHHRLEAEVVAECTRCHSAHSFEVRGESCLDCHREIFRGSSGGGAVSGAERAPGPPGGAAARPSGLPPLPRTHGRAPGSAGGGPADPTMVVEELGHGARERVSREGSARGPAPAAGQAAASQDTTPFTHEDHRELDCLVCHQSGRAAVPETEEWCASCHHEESTARACTSCHSRERLRSYTARVERRLTFSVGEPRTRDLRFEHAPHDTLACTTCHTGRPALSAAGVSCSECHEQHHSAQAPCTACHARAPSEVHPVEVHLTCSGSGCHDPSRLPVRATSRRRNVCVACHQDQVDHRTGQECVHCHVLPDARQPVTVAGGEVGAEGPGSGGGQ